jgi:hypothetical protein
MVNVFAHPLQYAELSRLCLEWLKHDEKQLAEQLASIRVNSSAVRVGRNKAGSQGRLSGSMHRCIALDGHSFVHGNIRYTASPVNGFVQLGKPDDLRLIYKQIVEDEEED